MDVGKIKMLLGELKGKIDELDTMLGSGETESEDSEDTMESEGMDMQRPDMEEIGMGKPGMAKKKPLPNMLRDVMGK